MEPEKARAAGWAGDSSFAGHGAGGSNMASAGRTGAFPERPDGAAACGSECAWPQMDGWKKATPSECVVHRHIGPDGKLG